MAYLGNAGSTSEVKDEELNQKRGSRMLEPGWYRCALIEDEAKSYDWGTGLSMQFQILSGDYEGLRIFEFLCVEHARSDQAQHIARVKLMEFALSAGHKGGDVEDTGPLYNKPVMVELYRENDDTKYADDDGKKARIGQFMSVGRWKQDKSSEPTPGIGKKKNPGPPPIQSHSTMQQEPPPLSDDDIPF